jgi:hypothetical protein
VAETAPTPEARFINGLDLCQAFFRQAVEPVMREKFPQLRYSAALIGAGSEVLGFDTEMSCDHHWGPRVMLFVEPEDIARHKSTIAQTFSQCLPRKFEGYPTGYTQADAHDKGVQLLDSREEGPINHRIEINTTLGFISNYLGFDLGGGAKEKSTKALSAQVINPADWLTFPEQKLCSITAGRVFHDEIGLDQMRTLFSYYPDQVWLYMLASCWSRIEQDEHLMGRSGYVGDEIGSAVIGARLVRDLMRLCFLMAKCYAPYPKWFGTAFGKLAAAETLGPLLKQVLSARGWEERQMFLSPAYEYVAVLHNQLGITEPLPEKVEAFHGRPFLVISKGAFSRAICAQITDPLLAQLAQRPLIGSVDQLSDNTDLLSNACWRKALLALYGAG